MPRGTSSSTNNMRDTMTNEQELIHALDTIAFELHTSDEEKLQSIQNMLYSYEQMVTAQSVYGYGYEESD